MDKAQEAKRLTSKNVDKDIQEKERERLRLEKRKKKKENTAWSDRTAKKEERDIRKEKRTKKRKWLKEQQSATAPEPSSNKRLHSEVVSGGSDGEDSWGELAKEERMAKKLKKGEITQQEFDVAFPDL